MASHQVLDQLPQASAAEWEALTTAAGSWSTTLRLGLLLVLRRLPATAAVTGVVAVVLRVRGLL